MDYFIDLLFKIAQNNYFILFTSCCHLLTTIFVFVKNHSLVLTALADLPFTLCTALTLSSIFFPENFPYMMFGVLIGVYIVKLMLFFLLILIPDVFDLLFGVFFFLVLLFLAPISLGAMVGQILSNYIPNFMILSLTIGAGFIMLTIKNLTDGTLQKFEKLTNCYSLGSCRSDFNIIFLLFLSGMASCTLSNIIFYESSLINTLITCIPILGLGLLYDYLGGNFKYGHNI